MKIVKSLGVFEHTEEYEYRPTVEELLYWYSGTYTSFSKDNPYGVKSATQTITRFKRLTPTNLMQETVEEGSETP